MTITVNAPPTVATAASATPNPVTGKTTVLSVLGADDGGAANLTYTWATTGTPPAAVSFSANGTNAAKNTTATFTENGTYNFTVTITDAGGLTTTSSVSVVVDQQLAEIVVLPSILTVPVNTTQQCTAVGYDQFGNVLAAQPAFTWSVSGGGSINQSGLYTAPAATGDNPIIQAASGSFIGLAQFTTVATVADVVPPGADSGTGALLNVAGYSTSYVYTWSVVSKPAGVPNPVFSVNASTSAYQTVCTFYQAGLYELVCNFGNANGSGTRYCAAFEITVEQATTSIALTPSTAALNENGTQQFGAAASDQFGDVMSPEPAFTWLVKTGTGSVSSSGLYTAAGSPGTATVQAGVGSVSSNSLDHRHQCRSNCRYAGRGVAKPGHRHVYRTERFGCRRWRPIESEVHMGDYRYSAGSGEFFHQRQQRREEHHGHLHQGWHLQLQGDHHRRRRADHHQHGGRHRRPDAHHARRVTCFHYVKRECNEAILRNRIRSIRRGDGDAAGRGLVQYRSWFH